MNMHTEYEKIIKEELKYILTFVDVLIEDSICNVLEDSSITPEFSAVATNNLIKCYIDVLNALENGRIYDDVRSYLKAKSFTSIELEKFEERRKNEAEYYIGKQY